jgi:hypothetical protein
MRQIFNLFIILSLIGCKNKNPVENKLPENFLGLWKLTISKNDTILLSYAQLTLNKNNTYEYYAKDENKFEVFSKGNYKLVSDTIVLNSRNSKECFYIHDGISYDCKNFEKNDEYNDVVKPHFEMQTTIKDCKPISFKNMYGKFDNEKIIIRSNNLVYITKDFDCSKYIPGIKLKITK